jgi:hypothetical protein
LNALLKTTAALDDFSPNLKATVIEVFAHGYNLQMKIIMGFAIAQFLAVGLMWRRNQIAVVK